ncbi:hypothetical protein HY640_03845 [Candidatus Woesearchaeota archaeon]|nr:hypothetical protein [Candidatus Woesearchaeota archaeon]
MLSALVGLFRRITFFEKAILVVGLFTIIIGFYFIQKVFNVDQRLSWLMLIAIFSWLSLLILIILSSLNAEVREDLSSVIRENAEETRLLKEITYEMLSELKLLRQSMKGTGSKKKP